MNDNSRLSKKPSTQDGQTPYQFFYDLNIGLKLILAFGILVTLVLAVAWLAYRESVMAIGINAQTKDMRVPAVLAATQAQTNLLRMHSSIRAHLIFGDERSRQSYIHAQESFASDLEKLSKLANTQSIHPIKDSFDNLNYLSERMFSLRNNFLENEPAQRILVIDVDFNFDLILDKIKQISLAQARRPPSRSTTEQLVVITDFQRSYSLMASALRRYVSSGSPVYKQEYETNRLENEVAWKQLVAERDNLLPYQQVFLSEMEDIRKSLDPLPQKMFDIVESERTREDLYLFKTLFAPESDAMLEGLDSIVLRQIQLLEEQLAAGNLGLRATQQKTILGGAMAILFGLGLAFFFQRAVTNPIVRLTDIATNISKGNLTLQAPTNSRDEIGILAKAFNDMTAQLRNVISRLEERLEQLKNAERIAHLGHWDWDMVSDKLLWSDEMIRILGFSPGSIEPSYELLREMSMDVDALDEHVANALAGLRTFNYENTIKRPDNTIAYVQNHGEVTFDDTGRPVRFFGTSMDISERKNAQLALQAAHDELEDKILERTAELSTAKQLAEKAQDRAENANQAKSVFLANMSHELRTPLNAILGYAQIYLHSSQEEDFTKGLTIIQQSGEHLLTLINDILDTARIEAGKVELLPEPTQLTPFLATILGIVQSRAEAKRLKIKLETPDPLPSGVVADGVRLRQVLLNLLNNAVKFTDNGSITLLVSRPDHEKRGDDVKLRFEVIDTGIGISSDQMERIFSPFEQVSNDPVRRSGGSGLGLFISRQLVTLMGGELTVESKSGQGSVFSFEIILPEIEISAVTVDSGRKITGYQGPRRTILVVDDTTSNRLILEGMLKPMGFEISEAVDGSQAIAAVTKNPPDLILMDRFMPEIDGVAAMKQIRQSSHLKHVTAIAVSASVTEEDRRIMIEAGFNDFMSKPVHWARLIELLQTHLNLEWHYSDQKVQAEEDAFDLQTFPSPPMEELNLLQELAMVGDMEAIITNADRIEILNNSFAPFCRKLRRLAEVFDDKQILAMVQQSKKGDQETS